MKCNTRCVMAVSTACTCDCLGDNHGTKDIGRLPPKTASTRQRPTKMKWYRMPLNRNVRVHRFREIFRSMLIDEQELDLQPSFFIHNTGGQMKQYAFAILLQFTTKDLAIELYPKLKEDFIEKLPFGTGFDVQFNIKNWIQANRKQQLVK